MTNKYVTDLNATLVISEGVSKTGKNYRMTKVVIDTELYGEIEILLDTRHDRAGIILDMVARHIC